MTLSPLEIAKAFCRCAPLMELAGYKFAVNDILVDIGHVLVHYVDGVMIYDKGEGTHTGDGRWGERVSLTAKK